MSRRPRLRPTEPQMFAARVLTTHRVSPSFQRITLVGEELRDFDHSGFDHWFRLFIPQSADAEFELPGVGGRSWWVRYLALPESSRPHCSNYTVADVRTTGDGVELDIDVVLHWDESGELAGPVAIWATTAEPRSPVALLDQGLIFDPGLAADFVVVACDETGVPAARGILRSLNPATQGLAIIEVPTSEDVVMLDAPAGVRIEWIVKEGEAESGVLASLRALDALPSGAYAYVVGESTLATEGRRALHRAGVPKSQITFSGYWKKSPELKASR